MAFKVIPRDYQQQGDEVLWRYLHAAGSGNPIVAMPTGTGKAIMIAMIILRIIKAYPQCRVLMLTHVKELVDQNFEKFMGIWPDAPAGVMSAGLGRRDKFNSIIFGGVGTVVGAIGQMGRFDIVIVDECHTISRNDKSMYHKILNVLRAKNPALKVIGYTATPWRLGTGSLVDEEDEGAIFTDICFDTTDVDSFNRYIAEGYLMPLIPMPPKVEIDLSGTRTTAGDFNAKDLADRFNQEARTRAALEHSFALASDRNHWLTFTTSIDHAINVAKMMTDMGRRCMALHSKMPTKERDYIIEGFKAGEWAVSNMGILTTGFDFPALDTGIILSATKSPVKWVQILGRFTRPHYAPGFDLTTIQGRLDAIQASDKHNALILDFGGNTKRLGPINDPRPPKKGRKGGGEPIVKMCDKCDCLNHPTVKFCINCGNEFKFEVKIKHVSSDAVLVKTKLPEYRIYPVDRVIINRHKKMGKPDSIRVSYYTGVSRSCEYICPLHDKIKFKAAHWWRQRTLDPVPETIEEWLERIPTLPYPTHIRVLANAQYPEITDYCFDGTAFNTIQLQQPAVRPLAEVEDLSKPTAAGWQDADFDVDSLKMKPPVDFDDDIPF